jgi:RNA polymerase sigma-70 factor (TIGR02960 family)
MRQARTKLARVNGRSRPEVNSTLEAARGGDERAFSELTSPYRHELHVYCYRLLGSIDDAEDVLQETMIAAWRGLGAFAGRSSIRTWLYRIATNLCLNAIRDSNRRRRPEPVPPFTPPEPTRWGEVSWLQPYPDAWSNMAAMTADPAARYQARETIELAFVAALQHLPPRQAATLVLCDVLCFATSEVAAMFETTPTAVKGILQRARASIDRQLGSVPRTDLALVPAHATVAQRFADAYSVDDIDGVVELLTDQAWLAMPPAPHEYRGTGDIARFLRASADGRGSRRHRLVPTQANGQPAFGCYIEDFQDCVARTTGIIVLAVVGERITGITRFLDGGLYRYFDMPETVPLT